MLRELSVQNLALIEDVRVELDGGFCAWTGETGAGKSLLLGALGLLLGDRGSAELIRAGSDELRVTGRFELTRPELRQAVAETLGAALEEDSIILARRLNRSGRSTAYINDQPVTIAKLKQVGEVLVDIYGQREGYALLQPAYQLQLLDAFGKLDAQRQAYLTAAEQLRTLRRRYQELLEKRELRQRELALLRFEREELDAAAIVPGEVAELTREREVLENAQSLQELMLRGTQALYEDEGSVVELLGRVRKETSNWVEIDPRIAELHARLDAVINEVQDIAETFRDLAEGFESNPERLEEIEKRFTLIRRLEHKYKRTADELPAYRDQAEIREKQLQQQEDDLAGLEVELAEAMKRLRAAAQALSKGRHKVAKKLAAETQTHLADLGMPDARLDVVIETIELSDDPTADIPANGIDQLELTLAANKGEPARPLRKVASGGELSRTMLGLKTVLSAHDPVGTLVFDEIDSNVGGRLGDVLGRKLATLGLSHQVICVTHLPQVAGYASQQWTIRKQTRNNRTSTTITPLTTDAERIEELASMLRGESKSESTRAEAANMLLQARACVGKLGQRLKKR